MESSLHCTKPILTQRAQKTKTDNWLQYFSPPIEKYRKDYVRFDISLQTN